MSLIEREDIQMRRDVAELLVNVLQSRRVLFELSNVLFGRVAEKGDSKYSVQQLGEVGTTMGCREE